MVVGRADHRRMHRRLQKVKGVLRHVRSIMAETHRVSAQQADPMHQMDIIMENLILHCLDPETM